MDEATQERALQLGTQLVRDMKLDLSGLAVLTECASGPYAFTAVMARLAGAEVHAVGRDSRFGAHADNERLLRAILDQASIRDGVEVHRDEAPESVWRAADIVSNLGFLRPISRRRIEQMRSTAVIPLMWETWEFRGEDIDIRAAQERGIAVIGTNEGGRLDLLRYIGMMALKLMLELGLEVHKSRIALIGGHVTGREIARALGALGVDFDWYTSEGNEREQGCWSYRRMRTLLDRQVPDAILCAEHKDGTLLVGPGAALTFHEIAARFPQVRWGHIAGNVDVEELRASGIRHVPERIEPFGRLSYQAYELGPRPVLELHAAGLKVGEIAARARLAGASLEAAVQACVDSGYGQDFDGGFLNYSG